MTKIRGLIAIGLIALMGLFAQGCVLFVGHHHRPAFHGEFRGDRHFTGHGFHDRQWSGPKWGNHKWGSPGFSGPSGRSWGGKGWGGRYGGTSRGGRR